MVPKAIIPRIIITILTTHLFMAPHSESGSVIGILSGIMDSSTPTIGDIPPITGDTLPIIGVEATIHIMGAAAPLLTVLITDPISGKTS
jgi:hypothetical protein